LDLVVVNQLDQEEGSQSVLGAVCQLAQVVGNRSVQAVVNQLDQAVASQLGLEAVNPSSILLVLIRTP
jgi:hypothetical protein